MHVGAEVEHRDLDGAHFALDVVDQVDDLILVARVDPEGNGSSSRRFDLLDQQSELLPVPANHAGDQPFAREAPCDGAAGEITRANDQTNRGVLRHGADSKTTGILTQPVRLQAFRRKGPLGEGIAREYSQRA